MNPEYRSHPIAWTPERVAHLWTYYGTNQGYAGAYFSMHSGRSVLEFVQRRVPLAGTSVLDFGCGRGHMLQHLLAAGVTGQGLEFSAESADEAARALRHDPHFGGIVHAAGLPAPLPDAHFDVVLMIEVVEHLFDSDVMPTLREVHRLLRPGGAVVVTTPHAEDLAANMLHCPECGCTFHRWQHLRSFTVGDLDELMARAGFARRTCEATYFRPSDQSRSWVRSVLRSLLPRLLRRAPELPHLAYIGIKPVTDR